MDLTNRNIIHVKKNDIEYLQFRILTNYGIKNCYTTRVNGFDLNGKLEPEIFENNLKKLCECLEIERESIIRPIQRHSDIVERVDNVGMILENTDGLVTDKRGLNLCLSYADCTPILIFDPIRNVIANIHSGWKGTAKKIAQKGVIKMKEEYGSNPSDLIVCIGPCIKEDHFEVESDVKEIFENNFSYLRRNEDIIKCKTSEEGKYYINTTLINELILKEIGVREEHIYDSNICTVCNKNLLHSYRAEGDFSGRNVAIIGI